MREKNDGYLYGGHLTCKASREGSRKFVKTVIFFGSIQGRRLEAYRGGGCWLFNNPPPLPKFRRPSKVVSNSTRLWKLLKIAEFRTPTHEDVRKKGSKILELLSVRNCFTLAMTNKLAVIINNLKVPKIKKMLLYEMKFLVPNYSCLQKPWLECYRPQIPVPSVLCLQLNLLNRPSQTKFLGTPLEKGGILVYLVVIKFRGKILNCEIRYLLNYLGQSFSHSTGWSVRLGRKFGHLCGWLINRV